MERRTWNLNKVKRLKKKRLVQYNILYALGMSIFLIVTMDRPAPLMFGFVTLLTWLYALFQLYVISQGKTIGPPAWKYLQRFEQLHQGIERWKKKKIMESGLLLALAVLMTFLLFGMDSENIYKSEFPEHLFPFFGAWIGMNLGEWYRINKLSSNESDSSE